MGARGTKKRSRQIRTFLLEEAFLHPSDLVRLATQRFGVTPQAIHHHLAVLVKEGLIRKSGRTRAIRYELAKLDRVEFEAPLAGLQEDLLWRDKVQAHVASLPRAVQEVWYYGFTEMVNNVIDHSGGTRVKVLGLSLPASWVMWIHDDGVGIFRHIKERLGLADERESVLELTKGKLTTDPENHTGEGIFFTSRVFDRFHLRSGRVVLTHEADEEEDWVLETTSQVDERGTTVFLEFRNSTTRTLQEVFRRHESDDGEFGFTKTVVPVRLADHAELGLVSRSQAKRLLTRFERFKVIVLDFKSVGTIGQAFADQVFRVFANAHPEVELHTINMSPDVERMIARAKSS